MREDKRLDKPQWGERGRSHARRKAAVSATEQLNDGLHEYNVFLIVRFENVRADSREQAYQFAKTELAVSKSLNITGSRITLLDTSP